MPILSINCSEERFESRHFHPKDQGGNLGYFKALPNDERYWNMGCVDFCLGVRSSTLEKCLKMATNPSCPTRPRRWQTISFMGEHRHPF